MSEEELNEAIEFNLEYMEAMQSEEIFGGDYTSSVELKYANKEIEKLQQENQELKQRIDKAIEYIETATIDPQSRRHYRDCLLEILKGEDK